MFSVTQCSWTALNVFDGVRGAIKIMAEDLKALQRLRCLINQQNNPLFMLKKSDADREISERVWDFRTVCWDEMRAGLFSSQQGHGVCHQHHCTETSLSALNGILLAAVSQRVTCCTDTAYNLQYQMNEEMDAF